VYRILSWNVLIFGLVSAHLTWGRQDQKSNTCYDYHCKPTKYNPPHFLYCTNQLLYSCIRTKDWKNSGNHQTMSGKDDWLCACYVNQPSIPSIGDSCGFNCFMSRTTTISPTKIFLQEIVYTGIFISLEEVSFWNFSMKICSARVNKILRPRFMFLYCLVL
jgi:hypothetical protein